jgi:chromate transporter
MVVAFVGFVVGYMHPMFGVEHPFLAGAVAANLVT